jgi:hypothetical protein
VLCDDKYFSAQCLTNHLCGMQKFFLDADDGDEDAVENDGDQDADTSVGQRLDLKIYGSTSLCDIGIVLAK